MCDNRENSVLRRSSFQCNFTELINIWFHGREKEAAVQKPVQEQQKLHKKADGRIVWREGAGGRSVRQGLNGKWKTVVVACELST